MNFPDPLTHVIREEEPSTYDVFGHDERSACVTYALAKRDLYAIGQLLLQLDYLEATNVKNAASTMQTSLAALKELTICCLN